MQICSLPAGALRSGSAGPAPGGGGSHLGRLLQVGAKVLPADAGEAERGRDLALGEVQPPRFGEEVGLALGEAGVVEGGGQVDPGAVDRPPVVLCNHGRAGTQATPLTCAGRRNTARLRRPVYHLSLLAILALLLMTSSARAGSPSHLWAPWGRHRARSGRACGEEGGRGPAP